MLLVDRTSLSQRLQPLTSRQRVAFAASCAQRLAPCFLASPWVQRERPRDVGLVGQLLAELWVAATATGAPAERIASLVGGVERMPELTAYEEPRGRSFWPAHALEVIAYAGQSWRESQPRSVLDCAQRVFDTASILDQELDPDPPDPLEEIIAFIDHGRPISHPPDGPFQARELQRQQEDLAMISAAAPANWETVLTEMRRASEVYAQDFLAALATTHD
jgi:hypothetical protein